LCPKVDYEKAILAWERKTGKEPIDFATLVAEEIGDNPARVRTSVYRWRQGDRQPTGMRKIAVDKVLARDGKDR